MISFEIILGGIAIIGVFVFLFYISKALPDRRFDINDIPGANNLVLSEEETKIQQDFMSFLKDKNALDANVYLELGNYNVNPKSKGVFKMGNSWVVYEMAGWKEVKEERRFDEQFSAYKYFAKLRGLDWAPEDEVNA